MNVLNILVSGEAGGIETLNREVAKFSRHNNYYCFVFNGGLICEQMKSDGKFVDVLNIKSSKQILSLYFKIKNMCKINKIDKIVIHHAAPICWCIGILISLINKVPFYIYAHGNAIEVLKVRKKNGLLIRKLIFKLAGMRAKGIICISQSVANSIIRYYPSLHNKVHIIYNGVNLDTFKNDEISKNVGEAIKVLFVGRLVYEKGVHLLLEAISKCQNAMECYIVGDGPEIEKLEKKSKELNINQCIHFCGAKSNTAEWYKKADFFIHPAIIEEGFGLTIVEAMASGLPCIAFNKGAIPEIITSNFNGFIVEKSNSTALSNKIDEVIMMKKESNEIWNQLCENAIITSKKFDIKQTVEKFDDYLYKIV